MLDVELPSAAALGLDDGVRGWRRYPAYKDSGVPWLGAVPSHWTFQPLKWAVTLQRGHDLPAEDREDGPYPFVTSSGVAGTHSRAAAKGPGIVTGRYGTIGQFYLIEQDYWPLNTSLYSTDLHNNNPRFLRHMLAHLSPLFHLNSVKSAVPGVDRNDVHPIKTALPPLAEQVFVADFIDRETAKVDALVEKKRRLLGLIEEKRAALISQAVTKGLDPTAPMKDSGIAWLGQVPAHWPIAPIFARYAVQLGKMLNAEAVSGDTPAPYLRNVNVRWDKVDLSDLKMMDFTAGERQKFDLRPGDLLVCEGGEVGRTAIWRGELRDCYFQKAVHRLRPLHDFDESRFLYYVLRAAANFGVFEAEGNRSTFIHLTAEKLRAHRLPFPNRGEQRAIVAYLDGECEKLDAIATRVRRHVELLGEYRTALISAAVTGKIDVREA